MGRRTVTPGGVSEGSQRVSKLAGEDALTRLTGNGVRSSRDNNAAPEERRGVVVGWAYSPAARRRFARRGDADFLRLIGTTPSSAAGSSSTGAAGTARGCL